MSAASSASVASWFRLVRFSHSIFALPFALLAAWLAAGGMPAPRVLALVLVACVAARTAAMAFNRLVDREQDAENPRTAGRELPRGELRPLAVALLVAASCVVFALAAWALNPLSGALALPVLGVLLGYSYVKRVHWSAHLVLGLALALAPLGAWIAVRGSFAGDLVPPLLVAAAVLTWVAGFDLIYACQDAGFDRAHGLHSIPARFGIAASLRVSALLHALTVALLLAVAWRAPLSWIFAASVGVAAVLLVWQHRIVAPDDLSRVDMAFFTLNGWVGIGLFLGAWLDLSLAGGVA